MNALCSTPTATCITCSTVFRRERDEDGAPEIPGRKCAIAECETWICEGGCMEHHSLHCRCGQRVCQEHIVSRVGWDSMCAACAADLVNLCRQCAKLPVEHRYADGLGTCNQCHHEMARYTRGMPNCPDCGHRYWVRDMDEVFFEATAPTMFHPNAVFHRPGKMYACDCGLKFTREAAGAARTQQPAPFQPPTVKGESDETTCR